LADRLERSPQTASHRLFGEGQGAKVLGHVVRIAILNASWLPAKEVPLRVLTQTLNPV